MIRGNRMSARFTIIAFLVVSVSDCLMASPQDSFQITIREVQFPPNGKFVRKTQEKILNELNSNRSQLIRKNVWPVIEAQFPTDVPNSGLLPQGIVETFWNAILVGSENEKEATVSTESKVVARGQRAKLVVGSNVWYVSVGDPVSDFVSRVTAEGPETFSVPNLESAGTIDAELFHGMSIMMISEDVGDLTRQVFITVDEVEIETSK